ncbi:MAG: hypothetical protein IPP78_11180 [Holophagaceae bacterium]|nr:hypothetical protein [Holophagaceae bacterium]
MSKWFRTSRLVPSSTTQTAVAAPGRGQVMGLAPLEVFRREIMGNAWLNVFVEQHLGGLYSGFVFLDITSCIRLSSKSPFMCQINKYCFN